MKLCLIKLKKKTLLVELEVTESVEVLLPDVARVKCYADRVLRISISSGWDGATEEKMTKRILWAHLLFNKVILGVRLGVDSRGQETVRRPFERLCKNPYKISRWLGSGEQQCGWVRGSRFMGIFVVKSSRSYWHRGYRVWGFEKGIRAIPEVWEPLKQESESRPVIKNRDKDAKKVKLGIAER